MEQRPLRLGDIVDDYCTRERRVTNHVVVALVENAIRQTRCTTCDTEHAYKGAREPRLRKKPATSELYDQVLANVTGDRPSGHPGDVVETSVTEEISISDMKTKSLVKEVYQVTESQIFIIFSGVIHQMQKQHLIQGFLLR